jgi:hypothetical protein
MNNRNITLVSLLVILFVVEGFLGFKYWEASQQINVLKADNTLLEEQIVDLPVKTSRGSTTCLKDNSCKFRGPGAGFRCNGIGEYNTSGDFWCDCTAECEVDIQGVESSKEGPDCSLVEDGICPSWCNAGSDYDCCIAKRGGEWIQGRGCYSNPLLEKGINPDKVIMQLLEVSVQWEQSNISYSLEKIYLTPDVADLGSLRFTSSLEDKNFLVAEVHTRNKSVSGGKREAPTGNYLRVQKDGKNSAPLLSGAGYLAAQEDGVSYAIFAVQEGEEEFMLLAGLLSEPKILTIDFNDDAVLSLEGLMLTKEGYHSEYDFN